MKNRIKIGSLLSLLMLILIACSPEVQEELVAYDGGLEITNDDLNFEVAYNDIYAMPSQSKEVKSLSSSGEEFSNVVEGVTLESILTSHGLSKKEYTDIRFTAGDGYAITMSEDIFDNKDIILAYKIDGDFLDESKMPLSVALDDVRSMYFVSNLIRIELISKEEDPLIEESNSRQIIILETAIQELEEEEVS